MDQGDVDFMIDQLESIANSLSGINRNLSEINSALKTLVVKPGKTE